MVTMSTSAYTRPTDLVGFLQRNSSAWVGMSLHSDTLSWFQVNQSLLFFLNATCVAEQ